MDEEIERLIVSVRADVGGFARDVTAMRGSLEGPLEAGVDRAGRAIESTLSRAIRTGKLGFDDLRRVALSVLSEIADAAIRGGIGEVLGRGGGGGSSGGLLTALGGLIGGLPGRATGGPVSPGAAYLVGERGPELFVPTASGRVVAPAGGAGRQVNVSISVNAAAGAAPAALQQSSRQVARAVRAALEGID
jgi:phage-related minor tail protein